MSLKTEQGTCGCVECTGRCPGCGAGKSIEYDDEFGGSYCDFCGYYTASYACTRNRNDLPMTSADTRLTPQQVSGLSDNELSEAVAREVLGASEIAESLPRRGPPYAGLYFWRYATGEVVLWAAPYGVPRQFSPSEPASALYVIEHMRQHWRRGGLAVRRWSLMDWDESRWLVRAEGGGPLEDIESCKELGRAVFEVALLSMLEERT